ncbi:T9SS type A sorting domain-containing protein [Chitinophaga sp.]|uniref:T9SS type A sorting domain-containing protein n=1 Tax=Chitinophaga sp. TaxID=1869181 RepID=UPI0031D54FE6
MKNIYPLLLLLCSLTASAQQSPYFHFFYDIPGNGPTQVLDFQKDRLLYWRDSAYHIHQLNTGNTIDIPLHQPPALALQQDRQGWLTDSGAFVTVPSDVAGMVALYEWRGQTLSVVEKQATSVEVGGNDVLWTSWGYFYSQRSGAEKQRVSTNPGTFTMSPEGWYLYSLDDTLYLHKNGVTTPFATGEETSERFLYVVTDGQQIMYLMEKAHQNPTLYLYNGTATDTVAILRGSNQQIFFKQQYSLNNGYAAFVSIDQTGDTWPYPTASTTVYVRAPSGKRNLAFSQLGDRGDVRVRPELWGLTENGGLLLAKENYRWENGLHYTPWDSASRFIASFPWNGRSQVPPHVYKDGSFYVFYNDSVYRVQPDMVKPKVLPFEVTVQPGVPYRFTLDSLLNYYTGVKYGPGQLQSAGFFNGPYQGYLVAAGDTLQLYNRWIDRARLDSLVYLPSPNASGIDSVLWTANDGATSTPYALIRFRFAPVACPPAAVTLTSSINVVNNNSDTVVLTAHGSAPGLFAFARDTSFTSLLRPESTDSVLLLPPGALQQGGNNIYVRLRTGCGTDSVATDRVHIIKTFLSHIPGKDFDSKLLIIVYPNPFTTQFTVEGLQPSRKYVLTLHDLSGRTVVTVLADYLHKINIVPNVPLNRGVYFLKAWDVAAQQTVGGAVLLKL